MFDPHFTFSKRQIGGLAIASGLAGLGLILIYELLGLSASQGEIGPLQRLGLLAAFGLVLLGLTLIPLGKVPFGGATPSTDQARPLSPLTRILIALGLLLMLGHFLIYVVYAVELIRFPFDYDQGEGFELVDAVYFSEGRWPYQNADVWPFYSSNYPPVYRLSLAPFAAIFGPAYWYGRLLSFVGTLITAGVIGWVVYRHEKRRDVALLLGLAFLASNYIYHIGPLFRQHYFMVMFEALAVATLAPLFEHQGRQQTRRLILGLGLLFIAGYTKQLAAVTVIACFAWLFIRQPRLAIHSGLGFGLVTGLTFLFINLATDGQWWLNVVGANVNEYIPTQFSGLMRQFLRLHWALLIPALLLVAYELYFARLSLYSLWFGVALLSTIGSGTWGAGDSYFATALVAACMLSGIFIARSLNGAWVWPQNFAQRFNKFPATRIYPLVGAVGLVLMLVYGGTVLKLPTSGIFEPISEALNVEPNPGHRYPLYDAAGWTAGYATIGHLPSQADYDAGWEIVARIQALDTPVMSEEAGFSLQAGREVVSNPTQLKNLYANGLLDPSNLVRFIEEQGFGMVIFRARFYPEPVLAAVDDAYYPREVISMNGFDYQLWYPESTWPTRRQIRDHLEAGAGEILRLDLPESLANADEETLYQWVIEMMGRWAWLPSIDLNPDDASSSPCEREFIRREGRALINWCEGLSVGVLE